MSTEFKCRVPFGSAVFCFAHRGGVMQRLIKHRALLELCGNVDRSTVHRWVRNGHFPAPLKIRGQCFWNVEEVVSAIQKHARESRSAAKAELRRRAQVATDVQTLLEES